MEVGADLANYLGRALGGLILPVVIIAYIAAMKPWEYREHLEIILYSLVSVLAWYFYLQPPETYPFHLAQHHWATVVCGW